MEKKPQNYRMLSFGSWVCFVLNFHIGCLAFCLKKSQAHTHGRLPETLIPILVKLQYPDFGNKAH